jgi:hypothetical protein
VLAEITDLDTVAEQCTGRLREQHLTAVARSRHPRCPVDIEPDIASVDQSRLTRIQADADTDLTPLRPRLVGKRALRIRGSRYRLACRLEGNEERILPRRTQLW